MIDQPGQACPICGNLVHCTCTLQQRHEPGCRYLRAAMLSIELACEHGLQACTICDPCDCNPPVKDKGIR